MSRRWSRHPICFDVSNFSSPLYYDLLHSTVWNIFDFHCRENFSRCYVETMLKSNLLILTTSNSTFFKCKRNVFMWPYWISTMKCHNDHKKCHSEINKTLKHSRDCAEVLLTCECRTSLVSVVQYPSYQRRRKTGLEGFLKMTTLVLILLSTTTWPCVQSSWSISHFLLSQLFSPLSLHY